MKQTLYYLNDDINWFPSPDTALVEPDGLLAIGGDLNPSRVFNAYQQGIFPWFSDDEPLMWWSPDPRAILLPNHVRLNKSLKKFLRKCNYSVSINTAFDEVIKQCAKPRPNSEGTWILPEMQFCYNNLYAEGLAHSIEIWQIDSEGKNLVGGLYGVNIGNCFCGESMFSKQPNASKLALLVLANMVEKNNGFIDCQLPNPYLSSMGATLISRELYLNKLKDAQEQPLQSIDPTPKFIDWRPLLNL